ncbi:hypothetical protein CEXT_643051 [Caerostris extrusa]|uniref:Uncharacterized protein n=1 Tax=Caerostris extrusa TaxID=172846 RepID=A0AAV4XPH3_CAEEX|nr:hypothetical protein CEXT_643051 [Caerostris extrusa]
MFGNVQVQKKTILASPRDPDPIRSTKCIKNLSTSSESLWPPLEENSFKDITRNINRPIKSIYSTSDLLRFIEYFRLYVATSQHASAPKCDNVQLSKLRKIFLHNLAAVCGTGYLPLTFLPCQDR